MKLRLGDTSGGAVRVSIPRRMEIPWFLLSPYFCVLPPSTWLDSPILALRLIPGKDAHCWLLPPIACCSTLSSVIQRVTYFICLLLTLWLCWQYEKQYWKLNLKQMTACVHPVSVQIQLRKKVLGTLAFFVSFISRSLAMLSCTLSSFTFPFLPLMLLQKHFVPPFTSLDSFNPGWATLE